MLARREVSGGTLVFTARWSLYGGLGQCLLSLRCGALGL